MFSKSHCSSPAGHQPPACLYYGTLIPCPNLQVRVGRRASLTGEEITFPERDKFRAQLPINIVGPRKQFSLKIPGLTCCCCCCGKWWCLRNWCGCPPVECRQTGVHVACVSLLCVRGKRGKVATQDQIWHESVLGGQLHQGRQGRTGAIRQKGRYLFTAPRVTQSLGQFGTQKVRVFGTRKKGSQIGVFAN